jgi:hypothetical protein
MLSQIKYITIVATILFGALQAASAPVPPPSDGLQGASNYIFDSSGSFINGTTVTIDFDTDFSSGSLGATFILTCFSPADSSFVVTSQQFSLNVTPKGKLQAFAAAAPIVESDPNSDYFFSVDMLTLPNSVIPAGSSLEIALSNDENNRITSITYAMTTNNGDTTTKSIDLLSSPNLNGNPETAIDLTPIVAFQFNIVGFDSNKNGKFGGGSGTISYIASTNFVVGNTFPPFLASDFEVIPSSNMGYGSLEDTGSNSYSQSFKVKN